MILPSAASGIMMRANMRSGFGIDFNLCRIYVPHAAELFDRDPFRQRYVEF